MVKESCAVGHPLYVEEYSSHPAKRTIPGLLCLSLYGFRLPDPDGPSQAMPLSTMCVMAHYNHAEWSGQSGKRYELRMCGIGQALHCNDLFMTRTTPLTRPYCVEKP